MRNTDKYHRAANFVALHGRKDVGLAERQESFGLGEANHRRLSLSGMFDLYYFTVFLEPCGFFKPGNIMAA